MSTSLPCLMTRRKKIAGTRTFNAGKVLADYSHKNNSSNSYYNDTYNKKTVNSTSHPAGVKNRDNPNQVCFLYENPRFINEAICYANTSDVSSKQSQWWPEHIPSDVKPNPSYKSHTVSRQDYKVIKEKPEKLTRYGSNKYKNDTAKGMSPNFNAKEFIGLEKISYEHQFDCRQSRKERGKLHGSFVWEPVVNQDVKERIKNRLAQQKSNVFSTQ